MALGRTLCRLSLVMLAACGGSNSGQPSIALYSFGANPTDALLPSGSLLQGSDGDFYGISFNGGIGGAPPTNNGFAATGAGTVFRVSPTGQETILHLFAGGSEDGAGPQVLIQGSDGNLYGTTAGGGAHSRGTVFRLTLAGVETILYSFGGPV
jgi:uncharacterized repeat protein (TIGR03803 family)